VIYLKIAKEVKEEILSKIKSGEKVPVLAERYGVAEGTIYSWLRVKSTGVSLSEHRRVIKENTELKEIVGALTMELTKLKKRSLTSTKG
jgi:transposase-like protein